MLVTYKKDHRARSFDEGIPFSNAPGTKPWQVPPAEPVVLTISADPEREGAPLPTMLEEPVPMMNRKLLEVLRGAGVDNIDSYRAELRKADGALASDDYVVFNLIGVVSAVDLGKSKFDADQPDRKVSMIIDSAVIDEKVTRGLLMFRLAENITTILIDERVKQAIERSGLKLIRIDAVDEVALL